MKRALSMLLVVLLCIACIPLREAKAESTINEISCGLTEPRHEDRPDYVPYIWVGSHSHSQANNNKYFKNDIIWSGPNGSIEAEGEETFVYGEEYDVTIYVEADEGYVFADSDSLTVTLNGENVEFVRLSDTYARLYGHFVAQPIYMVSDPEIMINYPSVGERPDYQPTVLFGHFSFGTSHSTGYNANYMKNDVCWQDVTTGEYFSPNGSKTFVGGHQYKVAFYITPDFGYAFYSDYHPEIYSVAVVDEEMMEHEVHTADYSLQSDGSGRCEYTFAAVSAKTYTVTLNPNGGSVSPTTKTVTYGQAYGTLPTPTRKGYTFAGWWTAKDTGGKQVTASTVCYATGNYTLYARWTVKTFTITLNPNGGSVSPTTKTVTYGQAYGTLPTPTRSGYTFDGWWTAKDSGGKKVTASTVCYASGNYTLYARWKAGQTYTVTLNPNGGTCGTSTKTVTYGQAYGTMPVPTRKGYTFAGWWTAKTGGKKVTASTICYASGNYTLYARWTEGYTMTFNPNGGTVSPTTKVVKYGQQYGSLPTPTRAGYTFAGWWTAKTGGKQVTASTVCYASAGYTLYARWTAKKFVVTLNPNGGECATATKTVTYGQAYGTMPVPSPRTGYTFAGWYTAKTGGKKVTATTICYATGNYTLYARWTPKTYTVSFNPNGGSCTVGSKTVTYGQQYGTLPTPTRAGYTFAGWFTTQTTGGKQVFSSTTCYATGSYTLYARWTKNP